MAMKDGGVQVGGLGAQPGPQSSAQGGAQVQQPHFIRMYRDSFSAAQCDEVIRRFEADERKHASTTATRDKPRLRSGTMLQIGDLPEWQDIAQMWSQALEKNLQAYAEASICRPKPWPGSIFSSSGGVRLVAGVDTSCFKVGNASV